MNIMKMKMILSSLIGLLLFYCCVIHLVSAQLQVGFYNSTCPQTETIVRQAVQNQFNSDPSITAALLRMHFHDCFVRVSLLLYVFSEGIRIINKWFRIWISKHIRTSEENLYFDYIYIKYSHNITCLLTENTIATFFCEINCTKLYLYLASLHVLVLYVSQNYNFYFIFSLKCIFILILSIYLLLLFNFFNINIFFIFYSR